MIIMNELNTPILIRTVFTKKEKTHDFLCKSLHNGYILKLVVQRCIKTSDFAQPRAVRKFAEISYIL